MNNINQMIENVINFYNSGGNPNEFMQSIIRNNPDINMFNTQLKNMAQGKNMTEFLLQLAKQNGVNEKNLEGLARILGAK